MLPHWMFNCESVSRKVSESLDRDLPLRHRLMIRIHVAMCKYCARFRKQLIRIRELCRQIDLSDHELSDLPAMPATARERITRALRSAKSSS